MDFFILTVGVWEPITVSPGINWKWPVGLNVKSTLALEKWARATKCMQGLISMFSISIPINSTIHLPESEKSGGDLRNKRLFFPCEQESEWETAGKRRKSNLSLLLSSGPILCTREQASGVLFDWCRWSPSLHSEDGAISATPYWICTKAGSIRHKIQSLTTCSEQQWIHWRAQASHLVLKLHLCHITYSYCFHVLILSTVVSMEHLDSKNYIRKDDT